MTVFILKIISGGAPIAWLWWIITHDSDGSFAGALGYTLRLFGGVTLGCVLTSIVLVRVWAVLATRSDQRRLDAHAAWRARSVAATRRPVTRSRPELISVHGDGADAGR